MDENQYDCIGCVVSVQSCSDVPLREIMGADVQPGREYAAKDQVGAEEAFIKAEEGLECRTRAKSRETNIILGRWKCLS